MMVGIIYDQENLRFFLGIPTPSLVPLNQTMHTVCILPALVC